MQAQPLEKHPDCPSIACPPRATLWQLIWIGITPVITLLLVVTETTNAVWGTADTRVVGPSRFWVAGRRVPEPNADALKTAPAFQYLPHTFRDSSWTQQEHERLQRAILQAVYVRCHPRTLETGRPCRFSSHLLKSCVLCSCFVLVLTKWLD